MKNHLIRTPVFTKKMLHSFFESSNPEKEIFVFFQENNLFKESIYLFSKVLFNEVLKCINNDANDKKKTSVANSLLKYFMRMCYRPTPFGTAAGISLSTEECNSEQIKVSYRKRNVKIDSRVILNVLKELNTNKTVRDYSTFYLNNTVYKSEGFYRFLERRKIKDAFDFTLEKIEQNFILDSIVALSKDGITLPVIKKMLEKIEDITIDEINNFIEELISSQLIISDLQYDVLDVNIEKNIYNRISTIYNYKSDPKINEVIQIFNQYFKISNKLRELDFDSSEALKLIIDIDLLFHEYNNSEKCAIQIDIIGHLETDKKFDKIEDKIFKILPSLRKIDNALRLENKDISNFREAFYERYGTRAVPLLEVLDTQLGIGFPVNLFINRNSFLLDKININMKYSTKVEISSWDEFVIKKYHETLKEGGKKILLKVNDLSFLEEPKSSINDSILFTGQLCYDDKGQEKYAISSIKIGAAHFIAGRFSYADKNIEKICNEIVLFEEEKLQKNQVYTELSHLSQPVLGNLTLRTNSYKYCIPILDQPHKNSEFEIQLNDLYVSIMMDQIILYSKKLDKQILPRLGCAQNTEIFTNPIYKFLAIISDDYFLNYWNWGYLGKSNYLPRVEFEGIILSKERWVLKTENIFQEKPSIDSLEEFIKIGKINRNVTMSSGGDNFLPLDLENNKHIQLLYKELLNLKTIILEEQIEYGNLDFPVYNNIGPTQSEICFPLHKKINLAKNQYIDLEKIKSSINLDSNSYKNKILPFQECLYIKLYPTQGIDVDKVFILKLSQFIDILKKKKVINLFFFIRYIDPDYHFRLRFFNDPSTFPYILNLFYNIFNDEISKSYIKNIQIDTYEKETERYGGNEGLEISEKIFEADSFCVLNILKWILNNNKENEKWLIAMIGVDHLLDDCNTHLIDKIKILNELRDFYYSNISNLKDTKRRVSNFYKVHQSEIFKNINEDNFKDNFFPYYKERSNINKKLFKVFQAKNIDFNIKNYIHMFLNRLFESDQNIQESIIYDLLLKYYKSSNFINKKQQNDL